eukprot:3265284-Pyramimonas_sp.AAC.1
MTRAVGGLQAGNDRIRFADIRRVRLSHLEVKQIFTISRNVGRCCRFSQFKLSQEALRVSRLTKVDGLPPAP